MAYMKIPTIVCDIDGVIADGSIEEVYSDEAGWAYEKCKPIKSMIDILVSLKKGGIRIILFTARLERDREITEKWLNEHKVPYDELKMNKPFGHIYIDDRGIYPFNPSDERWRSKDTLVQYILEQLATNLVK